MELNKNMQKTAMECSSHSGLLRHFCQEKMDPNVKKMSNGMYCLSHRTKGAEQAMHKRYMHSYRNISLNVLLQYKHTFQVNLL